MLSSSNPRRTIVRRLWAGLLGFAAIGAAFAQCPVVLTHSGANFSGGTFVIQAGMAEGEGGAASYTLAPSEFPIKINLAECVFAQQAAVVPTTTVWEVSFYDGTPDTGTLVASYQSDDVILPNLHMNTGTQGTNVQFSIDPGDPEQVYINNVSGTNTFSVAYRIIQHNSPPANPCDTPQSNRNAFMTTDANGLQQPSRNWLYAIDCGAFGAPPGWHSFNQLISLFRPTGDWNIRVTYESTNPLQITDQPDSVTVPLGQPAIFQVVAAGAGTLQYQWYKGTTALTNQSGHIFGATTDTLMIFPTVAADEANNYKVVVTSPCGSVTSDNAALSFQGLPFSGHVTLEDWAVSTAGQSVAIEIRNTSGTLLGARTVTLDASGNYTSNLPASVGAGTYNFFARGTHWLNKLRSNVTVTGSGVTGVNFTLTNGDIDNDNEVGPGDFGGLSSAFGAVSGDANWNPLADLDGDGEVGPSDFGILSTNFGEAGD